MTRLASADLLNIHYQQQKAIDRDMNRLTVCFQPCLLHLPHSSLPQLQLTFPQYLVMGKSNPFR